jgi:VWFA-related protein
MRKSMKRYSFVWGITVFLAFSAAVYAQNQLIPTQAPQKTVFQHEVSVVLKLIQVYVTDKDGNPIKNLSREDFVLTDNGEVRKITDFERHDIVLHKETTAEEKPAAPIVPIEPPSLNRKFFIFLDFWRNDQTGIKMSKTAARHFIETQVQPTDEVAVVSYALRKGLTIHEYLTRDHNRALAAINRIRFVPGWGDEDDPQAGSAMEGAQPEIGLGSSGADVEYELVMASDFNKILREFAQALRTVDGFKSIIFFSRGFARNFIYDMAGTPFSQYGSQVMDRYRDMIREFAASNCQVYSVNSEGVRALAKNPAARGTAALQELSELSGGKYFHDVANYKDIAQTIQNITGHYYVLGYPISESWDGRYHEVGVKVKLKGCEVYAQSGYYNPKPFGEYTEFEKQLQLIDLSMNERPNSGRPEPIPVAALLCSPGGSDNVLILAEIPARISTEISGEKTEVSRAVFDDKNQVVEFNSGTIEIKAAADQTTIFSSTSSLPPGKYKFRLVFRNPQTGRAVRGDSLFEVSEPIEMGLTAFPPCS